MNIRHRQPVDVGELDDEILARGAAQLDGARSRRSGREATILVLARVRHDLEFIAPHARSLETRALPTYWLLFIAFDLALPTRQAAFDGGEHT